MRIDSILAKVQSQGGHTIAVQRDAAIIPQAPEAHIPARAARISAVVSPRPSLYTQHPDDPFLAAILYIVSPQPVVNFQPKFLDCFLAIKFWFF